MQITFPEISVIVPVYKNKDTLIALHHRLVKTLETQVSGFEIVFVDDDCPEHSITVSKQIARQDDRVTVVAMSLRGTYLFRWMKIYKIRRKPYQS